MKRSKPILAIFVVVGCFVVVVFKGATISQVEITTNLSDSTNWTSRKKFGYNMHTHYSLYIEVHTYNIPNLVIAGKLAFLIPRPTSSSSISAQKSPH